jgi:hypothetical protein
MPTALFGNCQRATLPRLRIDLKLVIVSHETQSVFETDRISGHRLGRFSSGEHTSTSPGWMQGALESGNRVAREIIEATVT